MTDAIASFSGYIYAATMIAAFVYALVIFFRSRHTTPKAGSTQKPDA